MSYTLRDFMRDETEDHLPAEPPAWVKGMVQTMRLLCDEVDRLKVRVAELEAE